MNRSLKAAVSLCTISAALTVAGFVLIYTLEHPDRLHWCNHPEITNCTNLLINNLDSETLQASYTDLYTVIYNVSGCRIMTTVAITGSAPCEFALGGRAIDNGVVCYITPDCHFDPYHAGVVLTVMIVSALLFAICVITFISAMLLRYIPGLYKLRARKTAIIHGDL